MTVELLSLVCTLCRFVVPVDDAAVRASDTAPRCICLRCYEREIGDTRLPDKHLRQLIQDVTEDVPQ